MIEITKLINSRLLNAYLDPRLLKTDSSPYLLNADLNFF
jgi:hypothetical protein